MSLPRMPLDTTNCCFEHVELNPTQLGIWPANLCLKEPMLPIIFKRIAGLDVHKKTVVATRMRVLTQAGS